jgi:hypothetical protein
LKLSLHHDQLWSCGNQRELVRLFLRLARATKSFGEPLSEILCAQPPAASRAGRRPIGPALFPPLLQREAIPGGVGLDAVRAQETIQPEPRRDRGGRQVVEETALGIGRKRLVVQEEAGWHGVEVHGIAGGAELVAATFVDDEGFATSAEEANEELLAAFEAAGVSTQKPFHTDENQSTVQGLPPNFGNWQPSLLRE